MSARFETFQNERRADAVNVDRLAKLWADDLGLDGTDEVGLVECLIDLAGPDDTIHTIATAAAVITQTTIKAERLVEMFERRAKYDGTFEDCLLDLSAFRTARVESRLTTIAKSNGLIDTVLVPDESEIRRDEAVVAGALRIIQAIHLGWNR